MILESVIISEEVLCRYSESLNLTMNLNGTANIRSIIFDCESSRDFVQIRDIIIRCLECVNSVSMMRSDIGNKKFDALIKNKVLLALRVINVLDIAFVTLYDNEDNIEIIGIKRIGPIQKTIEAGGGNLRSNNFTYEKLEDGILTDADLL
jgi:hypothetical protein